MNKRQILRQNMRNLRSALTPQEVEHLSGLICRALEGVPLLNKAQNIMVYDAIRQEVSLNSYWHEQKRLGKRILLPRVKGDILEAVEFTDQQNVVKGPFGIREPIGEGFSPEEIDAVLVPGLVFDYHGNRLGYGKGYYDRFLVNLKPSAFFCGVAYHFQLVEDTFPTDRDVQLHAVATDKQLIWSRTVPPGLR